MSETTLQDVGPHERILTVEVPESDLDAAKNRAARKISREIDIKGFRPGKAPRKVVEATVGPERVRAEAIDDLLPEVVGQALEEASIEPAVSPSVEALRDVEGGVEVDVKVTLWPTLERVPEYAGRRIEVEPPELDEGEIQQQIDRFREQFAELETVSRPAQEGDFVSINLSTTKDGEPVPEVSASELLYEVGSNSLIDGLDGHVTGRSAGDIERFEAVLPDRFGELAGTPVTIQVLVKEVKAKRLPELTDEWVADYTEFETVDELRQELVFRIEALRRDAMRNVFQTKLVAALIEEMEVEIPAAIINAEMEEIFHRFSHRLGESGIELGDYLQVTGMTEEAFVEDLRRQAARSVSTDILLDAVAEQAGLEVGAEELAAVYEGLAGRSEDTTAEELADRFKGTVPEKRMVGDILRRKALATVVREAVAVDDKGEPIDLGLQDVEVPPEDGENGDTDQDTDQPAGSDPTHDDPIPDGRPGAADHTTATDGAAGSTAGDDEEE